jgi:glutamate synthase (NADPH/NADH) small chain
VEVRLDDQELNAELKRCQDCGVPFCHASGCPLGNAIPEMNAQALAGRWQAALATLLDTSPFPEFTARVCPALCEGSCVQGKDTSPVPCRQIEYEIIERGFALGLIKARPPHKRLDLSAAVVGSGPAGLAAAWQLNRHGVRVTVYEKDARPGGFLRYGIPDFKLEKSAIDRRVRIMEEEGIVFECGVEAGRDISERLLGQRHDIIVLACGARQKRDLSIPGRELKGIYFAVDYLSAQNRLNGGEIKHLPEDLNAKGRHVVVIGGGDTGSDCVGTANRQGAVSVSQYEIMPKPPVCRDVANPWPEWPRVLRTSSSHEEGCERRWNISSLAFLPSEADLAHVGAIECEEVRWEAAGGRLIKPVSQPDTGFVKKADLVLLAMGFTGVEECPLLGDLGVTPDRGRLPRDRSGRVAEGVYACGDSANGPSLVVRALNDGLEVARVVLADYGVKD